MKKILILFILCPYILLCQQPTKVKVLWATDSIFSGTNITAKDTIKGSYGFYKPINSYPANPSINMIVNKRTGGLDTLKIYNGSSWVALRSGGGNVGNGLFIENDTIKLGGNFENVNLIGNNDLSSLIIQSNNSNGSYLNNTHTADFSKYTNSSSNGSTLSEIELNSDGQSHILSSYNEGIRIAELYTGWSNNGPIIDAQCTSPGRNVGFTLDSSGLRYRSSFNWINDTMWIPNKGYVDAKVGEGGMSDTTTLIETRYHAGQTYKAKNDTINALGYVRNWVSDQKLTKSDTGYTAYKVMTYKDTASDTRTGSMTKFDHQRVSKLPMGGIPNKRVPFGNSSNALISNSALTYDSTNHVLNITKNNLGTTPSGGIELFNETTSTLADPVQCSPILKTKGSEWDTDNLISRTSHTRIISDIASGSVGSNTLRFQHSNDDISWVNMLSLGIQVQTNGNSTATFTGAVSGNTFTSTSTDAFTSTSNPNDTRFVGFRSITTVAATAIAKVNRAKSYLSRTHVWNGSASRQHNFDMVLLGIADTEKSTLSFQHSPDGGTTFKSMLDIEGYYTNNTSGTGNQFYLGNGASQTSPNLSITSAGKSTAIGADATEGYTSYDNTGNYVWKADTKTNIDNRVGSGTTKMILTPTSYLYRNTVATDSMYLVKKQIDNAISFATSGKLQYISGYDASPNTWPATGLAGGAILKGDWWNVTVSGTLGGVAVTSANNIYALTNSPGQTAANWDIVGSTDLPPVARTAGDAGVGYLKYNGNSTASSSLGQFYGGTDNPANEEYRLNINGELHATQLFSNIADVNGINAITARGIGTNGIGLYGYGTTNAIGIKAESSSTGTPFIANLISGTGNIAKYTFGTNDRITFDYTGKGTFNGGLVSTGVPLDSNYIKFKGIANGFFGLNSGKFTTGYSNTFLGVSSGINNTTGYQNTFIGQNAGANNIIGYNNIYIGYNCGGHKRRSNLINIDIVDDTLSTFIRGDMSADTLRINAQTRIGKGAKYTEIGVNGNVILPAGGTAAGTAPLKFTTQAAGLSTVEQGAMELIGNSLQFTNLAVRRAITQTVKVLVTDVTVGNTATETEIWSISHGAGYLEVGKKEDTKGIGEITSISGAGSNFLTIRIKYAGTTYATFTSTELSRTSKNFDLHVSTTCRAIGNGTTSIMIHGSLDINGESNDFAINTLATGLNSTAAQATSITAQWSDAAAGNTMTLMQCATNCEDNAK